MLNIGTLDINQFLTFLTTNAAGVALLVGFLGSVFKFWQWVSIKQAEEKKRKFETFHGLIKHLVEPTNQSEPMRLDKQIAIIYELRNFPEYFFVIKRILVGLRKSWSNRGATRLIEEIDLTLFFISKNWLTRKFVNK